MKLYFGDRFDRTNALVATGVWLFILVIFTLTKAPTVSFWDCGEFIAAANILGVPHPPGTPLYVMVSRLFILNPFIADMGARINWLSSLTSSLAALFGYLAAVRILRPWLGNPSDTYGRFIMYAGSAAGAMFLAFNLTQWSNSIEAEVYGFSMTILGAIFWLSLVYHQLPETRTAYRIMLLIVYLAFLGIGVHMTTFLIFPVAALFFVLKKGSPVKVWFLMATFAFLELYYIFGLSSRPGEIPAYFPALVALVLFLFYALSAERVSTVMLGLAGALALAASPILSAILPEQQVLFTVLSYAGLVICNGLAIWFVILHVRSRRIGESTGDHFIIPALFVLVVDLLMLMHLSHLHGYRAFLIVTVIFGLLIGLLIRRHINWPVLIVIAGTSLVIIGVWQFVYGTLAVIVVALALWGITRNVAWAAAALIAIAAMAGYSNHLYIPIRSDQNPYINENSPGQSVAATVGYLERKQYGSESMVERMFDRRAEWTNQFGMHRRMGLWGFFHQEYGVPGGRFAVVLLLGLVGVWEAIRRKPETGLFLALLIIIGSVGLVLYMNFADGTRYNPSAGGNDYLEVRDRDYFFTPAFMYFGLAIGIGMTMLIYLIRQGIAKFHAAPRRIILAAVCVLFLLPGVTIAANWTLSDRSNNYIPYDYAWNLLQSADPNAVLFTAGDNDTFPLWALQEAYGIRKDVRIVNLSLGNTKWYIKQVRDYMGLDLKMSDDEIDKMVPYRYPDGRTFRIQDQLIDAIITNNAASVPINFSITVDAASRRYLGTQLDSMMILRGAAFRLRDRKGPAIDMEATEDLLTNTFRFRGLNDPAVYKDEATLRTLTNIPQIFLAVADSLLGAGEKEKSLEFTRRAVDLMPFSTDAVNALTARYADAVMIPELKGLLGRSYIDEKRVNVAIARAYRKTGQTAEAEALLKNVLAANPTYRQALDELMRIYVQSDNTSAFKETLRNWISANPTDNQMIQLFRQLEDAERQARDSGKSK